MLKILKDAEVYGKKVLVRVDYNVPIEDGVVKDDTRIIRSLPTIKYLIDNNAFIILCSHLGRPKGERIEKYSLKPVGEYLSKILELNVVFSEQTIGTSVENLIVKAQEDNNKLVLLENTRFSLSETKNEISFAKALANLADIFVSDAFGTVHRAHASTEGVTHFLPSYAGLLVQNEYERISRATENPQRPAVAIVGGAKISTKLGVINKFIEKMDSIIIGGGMAYTFLKSQGYEIGDSLVENNMLETAENLMDKAKQNNVAIILPSDVRISRTFDTPILENERAKVVLIDSISSGTMGLDIGPQSEIDFAEVISKAATIIWNGPMGVFEKELYRSGTKTIADAVVAASVDTIIGGGDTVYALNLSGVNEFDSKIHISTGGGASLELLSGEKLPGIECLRN